MKSEKRSISFPKQQLSWLLEEREKTGKSFSRIIQDAVIMLMEEGHSVVIRQPREKKLIEHSGAQNSFENESVENISNSENI